MKIKPNKDRVIITSLEADETSPGGIILPQGSREKPQLGIVFASNDPFFNEGDTVLYAKYSGHEFTVGTTKFIALETKDIHCVIDETDEDDQ